MSARKRSLFVAVWLGVAMLLLQAAAFADPVRIAAAPDAASVATTIRTAHFAEPLVATAATAPDEDRALARALKAYEQRTKADDFSSLTGFLSKYPQSGWAPALLTNLGLSYLHYGYYSRALDAWQRAWRQGNGATQPEARALVDRAVGELARLEASLGQFKRLAALFDEIGGRPITGSATEAVQAAREFLSLLGKDDAHLFNCGPLALRSLMLARNGAVESTNFLQWHRVGPNGTSLAELGGLADLAKFGYRLIFRTAGQPVPMPAVVHWKVGHFAAILGEANGRFQVDEPQLHFRARFAASAVGNGQWAVGNRQLRLPIAYCLLPTAYCLLPDEGCGRADG